MYTNNITFNNLVTRSPRAFAARMTFVDNSSMIQPRKITSCTINAGSTGGDAFSAGAAFAGSVTLDIDTPGVNLAEREFLLEIGLYNGTLAVVYIPVGYFSADLADVNKTKHKTTMTAWDRMGRQGKQDYTPGIALPATVAQVVADIQTQTGLSIDYSDAALDYTYTGMAWETSANGLADEEIRDQDIQDHPTVAALLGFIAGFRGCFAYADRAGVIKLAHYARPGQYQKTVSADQCRQETWLADDVLTVDDGYTQYEYQPATVAFMGDPRLDPTDAIQYTAPGGATYVIPCMSLVHTYDGGMVTTVQSPSIAEEDREKGPIARRLARAEMTATEAKEAATDAQETAAEAVTVAQSAARTADSKNKVYFGATVPATPTGGFVVGDCWYDTGDDNVLYTWDGTKWVKKAFGHGALAAKSVYADNIFANYLSAIAADMGTITAGVLQSTDYKAPASGSVYARAGMLIDLTNKIIRTPNWAIVGGKLYAKGADLAGAINASSGTIGGFTIDGDNLASKSDSYPKMIFTNSDGGLVELGSSGLQYKVPVSGSDPEIVIYLDASGTSGTLSISKANSPSTFIWLSGNNGDIYASGTIEGYGGLKSQGVYEATTTSSPNVQVEPNKGALQRYVSSSRRYKVHLKDLDDAEKLLNLPVVYFRYKNDYISSEDQRYGKPIPGFYAEDVAEVYPIACDYADGKPEDWNVKMLVPPMLRLIQQQAEQIKALEARVATLEGMIS